MVESFKSRAVHDSTDFNDYDYDTVTVNVKMRMNLKEYQEFLSVRSNARTFMLTAEKEEGK